MALVNCGPTYTRTVSGCNEFLNIVWVPDGSMDVWIKVTLQSGKSLVYQTVSDGIGTIQLAQNEIAPGFWNSSDGVTRWEFYYDENLCNLITPEICGVTYTDLAIIFDDSTASPGLFEVVCVCEEEPPV